MWKSLSTENAANYRSTLTEQRASAGFTLVELAIAIVIIGLLLGGILVGQDIIRGSALKSAVSDKEEYVRALGLFQEKYRYLPGDFPGATALWGAADAVPATCIATASTGKETCDGGGDGRIAGGAGSEYEAFRAWQHLANEGMIKGQYTGVGGAGGAAHADIGVNVPESSVSGGGFNLFYVGADAGAGDYFSGRYGHALALGAATAAGAALASLLEVEEASELDEKYDDGQPGLGSIRTFRNGASQAGACATTNAAATAAYDFTQTGRQCHLIFITGF